MGPAWLGRPFYEGQCRGKASFVLTLITIASILPLKMKHNHCLLSSSVVGTEYRHLCWFIQPTTEQFLYLSLRDTAILPLNTPNFTSGMDAPFSDISYHGAKEACLWKSLLSLHIESCRRAVLPVGGLQRPCSNHFFSSFLESVGSGMTSLYM